MDEKRDKAQTAHGPAAPKRAEAADARDPVADMAELANPARSLFERAEAPLAGKHRGSPLLIVQGAANGIGAAAGIALVSVVRMLGGAKSAILPGVAGIAALCVVGGAVAAAASWRTRTWELAEDAIVLESGVLSKRRLLIPYEHIHAVGMSSKLTERILGLITLDLDTGASDEANASGLIKGMPTGMARRLRDELFRRKAERLAASGNGAAPGGGQDTEPLAAETATSATAMPASPCTAAADTAGRACAAPQPEAVCTLNRRELVLAALTQTRVLVQTIVTIALVVQAANFLQESELIDVADLAAGIATLPAPMLVAGTLAVLAAALVVGALASFVVGLLSYAGFRASRYDDRIVVEHGALDRSSRGIALERVQAVRIRQTLIRQLIGYAEVHALAAGAESAGEGGERSVLLHPFIPVADIDRMLERLAPAYALGREPLRKTRLPRAAARRETVRALGALAVLVALACAGGIGLHAAFPAFSPLRGAGVAYLACCLVVLALCIPLLAVGARLRYRDGCLMRSASTIAATRGGLTRVSLRMHRRHLQHATVSASPLQRRAGLATLSTRSAADIRLVMRDLAREDANEALEWFRPRRRVEK